MQPQAYYRDVDNAECDMHSETVPLQLNCTGCVSTAKPFDKCNHLGRQDYYLQYVTEGRLQVHSFGTADSFAEGMFMIYSPRTPYHYQLAAGDSISYYWAHFTGYHAARMLTGLGLETGRLYCTAGGSAGRTRIPDSFSRLFDEFVNRRPGFDEVCTALLTGILVELTRGVDKLTAGPMRRLASVAYLHAHYCEQTPISALAEMEHLSESRYREVFRAQTGFSPGDYRTALRLQRACDLLTLTEETVTEIADECGYGDVLYFLRVFKQKKGMTPIEYRRHTRRI